MVENINGSNSFREKKSLEDLNESVSIYETVKSLDNLRKKFKCQNNLQVCEKEKVKVFVRDNFQSLNYNLHLINPNQYSGSCCCCSCCCRKSSCSSK